jgi:transcriptional regulator with AAA-type ATPase domain
MPRFMEKVPEVESQHGALEDAIPGLLEKFNGNQTKVAEHLGLSPAFVSRWLRKHGYTQLVKWVKQGEPA